MYKDYLMHYRTKGALNGETKYPGKYIPIGEKVVSRKAQQEAERNKQSSNNSAGLFDRVASFVSDKVNDATDYVKKEIVPKVEKKVAVSVGPGMIRDEIKKNAYPAIDNLMKPNTRTYASNEDRFKDFIRNDIRDRINVKSNVAKLRAASRMKKSLNTAINDPRINREFTNILDKDHNHVERGIAESLTNPRKAKMYAHVGLDAAVPTYNRSKATTEDNFKTFMKNDLRDRLNKHLKIAKDRAATGYENFAERFLNDKRVQNDISEFRNNPYAAKDIARRKNVRDTAIDAAIPTYEKRKATTEDSFKTFMKNDIKDRTNDLKKKGKKKIKGLVDKLFHGDDIMSKNYLMHYGTPGSRWGYTKHPDKYKPIGKKANYHVYDSREDDPDWQQNPETDEWLLTDQAKNNLWKESLAETGDMYKNIGKKAGEGLLNVFTKGAYGRNKKIGKLIANQVANSNNVNTVPVYKPNNKSLAQKSNMEAAEARRRAGGNIGMTRSVNAKPILSGTKAVGMRGGGAYKKAAPVKSILSGAQAVETKVAIANNKAKAEDRRIKGGTYGQKTGENYYNDRGYNKRAFDARMRYEKRVKTPNSDKKASAERNARSTIGNAIHDARTDKDFGSFMKKDIKDRVSKGKKKVKKLLSKWF